METQKHQRLIDKNTKIPEDLEGVIYNITNDVESFGNDLKQLKEKTSKRIKNLKIFLTVPVTNYEENIQHEYAIFDPNEVSKLTDEIHGLKLENETLKIEALEREKMIRGDLQYCKTIMVNIKIVKF